MANTAKKTSELTVAANVATTDRFLIVRDPSGTPSTRTVTLSTVGANLILSNSAPANSTANGLAGEVKYDTSYLYICVSNNTWKRITLESY
jgi:hypothetical protein|tara:strand:+ start:955 stop:1227 length:273 start_codon:yes stop_codon:yes gene_type:complete